MRRGITTLTAMVLMGTLAIAMPSSAQAVEKAGISSLANDAGTTILAGHRETIWYKSGTSGFKDMNLKKQAVSQPYAGFYQTSSSTVWRIGASGWRYLPAGTNSPYSVLITNVAATTPMVVGSAETWGGSVTVVH